MVKEQNQKKKLPGGAVNRSFPGGFISEVLPDDPRDDSYG